MNKQKREYPVGAYIVTLIGGILGLIGNILQIFLYGYAFTYSYYFSSSILGIFFLLAIWALVCNILILWSVSLMKTGDPEKVKKGGNIAIIFSILALINIIALIGGILARVWKPKYQVPLTSSSLPPPSQLTTTKDFIYRKAKEYETISRYDMAAALYEELGFYRNAAVNYEKAQNYRAAAILYEKVGMYRDALRCKIKLAISYEKSMNYAEAARLYKELGMYEDARRCREKMLEMERYAGREGQGIEYRREQIVPMVDRERIREIYGVSSEKKRIEDYYNWGDFANYRILKRIGYGGFSEVYLVERDGKRYAMKIPRGVDLRGEETLSLSEEDLHSYGREAELWAMLTEREPNCVVNLIDAGVSPFPWFVMELADFSLRRKMKEMSIKEKLRVIVELLDKLDRIHHYGVVHKDIKPENILYANGEWKFTDFGLSKILTRSSKSSQMLSGTLLYMAPEQVSKKAFGHTDWRTDIWQMGILTYELLSNHTPFESDDAFEITSSIMHSEPASLTKYGIDEKIWKVVEKALRKNKKDRWQSAGEMKRALEEEGL